MKSEIPPQTAGRALSPKAPPSAPEGQSTIKRAPHSQPSTLNPQPPPQAGLGDRVERLVKPVALALQKIGALNCLDQNRRLKPESPCARRRAKLNDLGKKVGL